MDIQILTQGMDWNWEMDRYVVRRIHAVLGSFAAQVSRVRVQVEGINGPRGIAATRCRVHVFGTPWQFLVIQDAAGVDATIDLAIGRAGMAVAREVEGNRAGDPETRRTEECQ